ncbi:hypothetical protein L7F22_048025 [Adiantum nelumboides]|nr:hypothetical protein [Adiantum nelumboides]
MTRTKFPRSTSKTKDLLELVHPNLCGPMPTISLTGSSYILTFIDDWSKCTVLYFLKQKSEVLTHFQHYKTFVERQLNKSLRNLRTDNGDEYVSNAFKDNCMQEGIFHQLTVPYSPQQNGVAERKNRTLLNAVRAMILTAGMLSRYMHSPRHEHLVLANRLLEYINTTRNMGITFQREITTGGLQVIGYTDADWATDRKSRHSIGGFSFTLSGGAISWRSKRQATISLSSTESEYKAASEATKEALWINNLLIELGFHVHLQLWVQI